ncbi:protein-L-isoaspartate(D-aspartate) O-methyltransferase [Parvibaculum sp.]|uniref:protein-L-isoaspartate(D-aspartate) O-methyltransferase n=1 Tax=Parvibaculum sp. TaxID=2024848 RepID=UPI0038B2355F
MKDLSRARQRMIEAHLEARGIRSPLVLDAMRRVPREAFVEPGSEEFAYEDTPLAIGEGQTISQPYIVALMIEAARIAPGDRVLEVGTGSGYAAAVMSLIAEKVFTIERHEALCRTAEKRLAETGYRNVEVRRGDGTRGWPEEAPFDAILVAAGGPAVPQALKDQLAVGGRLVIPVGGEQREQRLLRVTRIDREQYEEEDLGGVMFVPLIGEEGWKARERPEPAVEAAAPARLYRLSEVVAEAAEPLPDPDDPRFGAFFDRFGSARVVMLGEASHGTSEFYRARAAITKRLIEEHGFNIVAVEADWPDAAAVDRHVRQRPGPERTERAFRRFPTWMWRNRDVAEFVDWLTDYNAAQAPDKRAGFYGLDLYNMSDAIAAVLDYLDARDPEAAAVARERYGCLTPWQKEPATYGRAVLRGTYRDCEEAVALQCRELLERRLDHIGDDSFIDAAQSARLVASAERYYRIMYYGGADAWNLRDTHMFETLTNLLEAKDGTAKAVVWAHNSHIGDARHTDMGSLRDEINIGQLARERFGKQAVLIGFGTHSGTVTAANDWDGETQTMRVRPSRADSYERVCHDAGIARFLLDMKRNDELRYRLKTPRLERFIGVIYRPGTELASHYAEASLSEQFDAYVWFDETHAVEPLGPEHIRADVPDTYPFGV